MIIPIKCFTCGKVLADKYIYYKNEVKKAKINLIGLSREELESLIVSLGYEKFRAKQIWHWVYHRGVSDFDQMTTLAKTIREELNENFDILKRYSSHNF